MDKFEYERKTYEDILSYLFENHDFADIWYSHFNSGALEDWCCDTGDYRLNIWYYGESEGGIRFEGEGFTINHGATRMVICSDYCDSVLKVSFDGKHLDYCAEELEVYESAKEHGCAQFFAPIVRVDDIYERSAYLMKSADCCEDNVMSDLYDKLSSDFEEEEVDHRVQTAEDDCSIFNELAYYYYSELEIARFNKFNDEFYSINDVHAGNIGYIGNMPVIIDYAGYVG